MKKAQKPFFSVLTPAWNRADFLEILIDSLQGQTFQNFEWVIGNDGSTDGSHELLMKGFADLKIPITYVFSNIRIGKSKLDNLLLDHARGEYLIWCDADDFFKLNALQNIAEIIKKNNIDSDSNIAGVMGQNLDTLGKSQTFNSESDTPLDGKYSWNELEKFLVGDGTICVRSSVFENKRWPEVDFLITESILLRPLYRNKNFYLTNSILKIMDRGAKNSVSFGSEMQYCRGSAYSLSGTINIEQFEEMQILLKLQNVINYFRYCIHGDISLFQALKIWRVLNEKKRFLILYPLSLLIALFDLSRKKVVKTHIEFENNKNKADIKIQHF